MYNPDHTLKGSLTRIINRYSNSHTTTETLPGGVTKYTHVRKRDLEIRILLGLYSLGLTEALMVHHEETYEFYYEGTYLGSIRNLAADTAFTHGIESFERGNFQEAEKWFNAAHLTCESGSSEETKFKNNKEVAKLAYEGQFSYTNHDYGHAQRKFEEALRKTDVAEIRDVLSSHSRAASQREVEARAAAAGVEAQRAAAAELEATAREEMELEIALRASEQEASTFELETAIATSELKAALFASNQEAAEREAGEIEAVIYTSELEIALFASSQEAAEREAGEIQAAIALSERQATEEIISQRQAVERDAFAREAYGRAAIEREAVRRAALAREAAAKDAQARVAAGRAALARDAARRAALAQELENAAQKLNTEGLKLYNAGLLKEKAGKRELALDKYEKAAEKIDEAAEKKALYVIYKSFIILIDAFMRTKAYHEAGKTMNMARKYFQDDRAKFTFKEIEGQIKKEAWSSDYLDEYLHKLELSETQIVENRDWSSSK